MLLYDIEELYDISFKSWLKALKSLNKRINNNDDELTEVKIKALTYYSKQAGYKVDKNGIVYMSI